MRPVLPTDLICAARAVMAVPRAEQVSLAQTLMVEAETADWHRRSFGDMHPRFGDGTLAMAAQNTDMAEERTICDGDFARALIVVLQMILLRSGQRRSQE